MGGNRTAPPRRLSLTSSVSSSSSTKSSTSSSSSDRSRAPPRRRSSIRSLEEMHSFHTMCFMSLKEVERAANFRVPMPTGQWVRVMDGLLPPCGTDPSSVGGIGGFDNRFHGLDQWLFPTLAPSTTESVPLPDEVQRSSSDGCVNIVTPPLVLDFLPGETLFHLYLGAGEFRVRVSQTPGNIVNGHEGAEATTFVVRWPAPLNSNATTFSPGDDSTVDTGCIFLPSAKVSRKFFANVGTR